MHWTLLFCKVLLYQLQILQCITLLSSLAYLYQKYEKWSEKQSLINPFAKEFSPQALSWNMQTVRKINQFANLIMLRFLNK